MTNAAQERVDIIDDQGQTVGTATRHEMRTRRLPHRCTYVLVFDHDGRLFVHLRTSTKDVYPNRWDVTVGGVLLAGETFEQGVRRELQEELGIEADAQELFPFRYQDLATDAQAKVYRVVHDGPFRLQPEEIVRGEFMPLLMVLAMLDREPFCPDGVLVLNEYLKYRESTPVASNPERGT